MTTLHLIRHGQTPNNVAGALDTALPGAGLTDLGMRQAEDLVRRFDGTPLDRVVSSAHRRAVLTAAPLTRARALEPLQDEGFGEVGAGDLEMMTTHESHMTYLTTVFDWSEGELDERMPGGPDGHSVLARYEAAIARAVEGLADDAAVAVVSHGAVIRLWATSQASGITPKDAEHKRLLNTAVVTLEGRPGDWRFVGWDDPSLVDEGASDPTADAEDDD